MSDITRLLNLLTAPKPTARTALVIDIARMAYTHNGTRTNERAIARMLTILCKWGYISDSDGVTLQPGSYGQLLNDILSVWELIATGLFASK